MEGRIRGGPPPVPPKPQGGRPARSKSTSAITNTQGTGRSAQPRPGRQQRSQSISTLPIQASPLPARPVALGQGAVPRARGARPNAPAGQAPPQGEPITPKQQKAFIDKYFATDLKQSSSIGSRIKFALGLDSTVSASDLDKVLNKPGQLKNYLMSSSLQKSTLHPSRMDRMMSVANNVLTDPQASIQDKKIAVKLLQNMAIGNLKEKPGRTGDDTMTKKIATVLANAMSGKIANDFKSGYSGTVSSAHDPHVEDSKFDPIQFAEGTSEAEKNALKDSMFQALGTFVKHFDGASLAMSDLARVQNGIRSTPATIAMRAMVDHLKADTPEKQAIMHQPQLVKLADVAPFEGKVRDALKDQEDPAKLTQSDLDVLVHPERFPGTTKLTEVREKLKSYEAELQGAEQPDGKLLEDVAGLREIGNKLYVQGRAQQLTGGALLHRSLTQANANQIINDNKGIAKAFANQLGNTPLSSSAGAALRQLADRIDPEDKQAFIALLDKVNAEPLSDENINDLSAKIDAADVDPGQLPAYLNGLDTSKLSEADIALLNRVLGEKHPVAQTLMEGVDSWAVGVIKRCTNDSAMTPTEYRSLEGHVRVKYQGDQAKADQVLGDLKVFYETLGPNSLIQKDLRAAPISSEDKAFLENMVTGKKAQQLGQLVGANPQAAREAFTAKYNLFKEILENPKVDGGARAMALQAMKEMVIVSQDPHVRSEFIDLAKNTVLNSKEATIRRSPGHIEPELTPAKVAAQILIEDALSANPINGIADDAVQTELMNMAKDATLDQGARLEILKGIEVQLTQPNPPAGLKDKFEAAIRELQHEPPPAKIIASNSNRPIVVKRELPYKEGVGSFSKRALEGIGVGEAPVAEPALDPDLGPPPLEPIPPGEMPIEAPVAEPAESEEFEEATIAGLAEAPVAEPAESEEAPIAKPAVDREALKNEMFNFDESGNITGPSGKTFEERTQALQSYIGDVKSSMKDDEYTFISSKSAEVFNFMAKVIEAEPRSSNRYEAVAMERKLSYPALEFIMEVAQNKESSFDIVDQRHALELISAYGRNAKTGDYRKAEAFRALKAIAKAAGKNTQEGRIASNAASRVYKLHEKIAYVALYSLGVASFPLSLMIWGIGKLIQADKIQESYMKREDVNPGDYKRPLDADWEKSAFERIFYPYH